MNWPRLKRRIRLQPNLIDPYRKISYREARRIWKEQGRPDVLELLEGARKKSGMTPDEWQALTGLKVKNARVIHSAALRRWAVACALVLLFSAFLAFTAPGRAFAAQVYKTFTTIAENILNIRATEESDTSDVEPSAAISEDQQLKLSSLEEAQKQVEQPLLYFSGSDYDLQNITVAQKDIMGLVISSEYTDSEGRNIILLQRWPLDKQQLQLDITLENAVHHVSYSSTGLVFDGAYTNIDGSYQGGTIQNSMLVTVRIDKLQKLETVDAIITDIAYYKKS